MFPYLLLVLLLVGLCLATFLIFLLLSSPKKGQLFIDDDQAVEIVKFVEAHRENLPISSAQGWSLVPVHSNLRCWKKELPFRLLGTSVNVYGCATTINTSAVIVLNVIADISTWPEWDFSANKQTVHLEVSEDPSLHGDIYMQSDQLVVTTTMVNPKPEVVMYRFGNLEHNGVGWILLWNAKMLEWTFYIAQPVEQANSKEDQCMLTAICGYHNSQATLKSGPEDLCIKVQNLSNAILNCQVKLRPFLPLIYSTLSLNNPHFPTIHSALSDLPETPCVLLHLGQNRQLNILQNCVLAVVPVVTQKPANVHNLVGFILVSRLFKKPLLIGAHDKEACVVEEKRRSRRRQKVRRDSLYYSFPRSKVVDTETRRSSSLSAPVVRRKAPELTLTLPDEEQKLPVRASSHSFLNLIFNRRRSSDASSEKRSKSPARSRSCSPSRKEKNDDLNKMSSASSQEEVSPYLLQPAKSVLTNGGASNHSDVEKESDSSQYYIPPHDFHTSSFLSSKGENMDYKAVGEHCVAVLVKENTRACQIDINTSEEEQKRISGGWVFKEMNKDVTVFKKVSSCGASSMISHLCRGIIPCSSTVVWKTLCNPLTRFMYDDTAKKISVLSELSCGQKLIHMYNESVTLLKKEVQDFCLLQTERKEDGGRLILAFHSVEDKICPPAKDITRGTVIASGWVVENVPESPDVCMVSYLMQFSDIFLQVRLRQREAHLFHTIKPGMLSHLPATMIVSSPETQLMEEISNVQSQCINNLSTYLAAKPPC